MFKNYLKIAFRNLYRYKIYSLINIMGLAIGIALFVLIILLLQNELNYDKFNKNLDSIYRLEHGDAKVLGTVYADLLLKEFPEVRKAVRFNTHHGESAIIKYGEKRLKIQNIVFADSSIFDVFTFPFIQGAPKTALGKPFTIVLTESIAKLIFNNENPIGKIIRYNNRYDFIITGIIKDINNFHIPIDAIASFISFKDINGTRFFQRYDSWNYPTFLLLPENHDVKSLGKKINNYFKNIKYRAWERENKEPDFHLRPLKNIYFSDEPGKVKLIYLLITLAIIILLIACINFTNLTTARGSLRAKEVGIRKVVGAQKGRLIMQFLGESILICSFAFILAIALTELLLPYYNNLISTQLSLSNINTYLFLGLFVGGALILGFLAGIYPAFYLTSFHPTSVLKSEKVKDFKSVNFRKILIVFQFSISIILITGTLIIAKQLDFMNKKYLGFKKQLLITVPMSPDIKSKRYVFKERLLQNSDIRKISYSLTIPGHIGWISHWEINGEKKQFNFFPVDPDYIELMGLELIKGRNFSWDIKSDENNTFVLNEEAVQYFGWKSPLVNM